jgi:oxaloacetate decarboxylase (Na+ extruding) subunit alpha
MGESMNTIRFVDTTLRDGHQSLWAENMTTAMMLPIAQRMDQAGFEGIELISGSHLKKTVRELREDPWERVRLVAREITRTPLRVIAGRVNTFEYNPPSMYWLFIERMFANGIREARISDEWNDFDGWKFRVGVAHAVGMKVILNLIYSVSPKHSDDYFAERTRQAASLKPYRLCLKDPGGLLTPERMRTLVPIILRNAGGIPVELHTHCTTGLGPLCCLEAIKLGIRSINTALPPLADDSSNPSLFNVAKNARTLGYTTAIEEEMLQPVSEHFAAIAKREGFTVGAPVEYDVAQYQHQVPGGMLSNLRHQLRKVGLEHRFPEALEESVRVRAEFGYPIMVTPLSQFVGSQAAINVIVGERYREVTDQVIKFALGHAGPEGARDMDPNVKDKILNRARAKEWANWQADEPSAEEMRRRLNAGGVSDEELLLRWIVGKEDIDAMRANPRPLEYLNAEQPLVNLLRELSKRSDCSQIHVQRSGFSITLEKRNNAGSAGSSSSAELLITEEKP